MRILFFSCLTAILAACSTTPEGYAAEDLDSIVRDYEALQLEISPYAQARANDTLPSEWADISPEREAKTLEALTDLYARLGEVDTSAFTEDRKIDLEILKTIINDQIRMGAFDENRVPFTGDSGFGQSIVFAYSRLRFKNEADVAASIERLQGIPDYLDANVANMRRGLETGFVSYKDPLETVITQMKAQIVENPEDSDLYQIFKVLPDNISAERQAELQEDAKAAIAFAVEGFAETVDFLENDYAPNTRDMPGVMDLPQGRELYSAVLAMHTTRDDLTPEDVHEIGLEEVARIRAEMDAIIEEVGFEGSFAEFLAFLRTDPQFYPKSADDLMRIAARISKDVDYEMPKYFATLPRLSYGVQPVPLSIAPGYTSGRYVQGDPEDGQAGIYWVNTYALDQRPLYELPALTTHEAVPGHHHQIALGQELENVPEYRRNYYATAFGEGWGLYSEYLGREMGIYKTPYERFGQLSMEMWRACRLVADTGLHWYGWTREEGEACFVENSALSPLNIETEVTRYIGWPGQATAYKMGELTIKALRAEAEAALGDDFDIREFHDVVLEKGALPLGLLEERVRTWIAEQTAE
ncbi:MAG: DUF885 domain-containing protein [Ponticaulis sp.]|nr:DUF885 domain-containing protein [Ponticaulis sp.]